MDMLHWICYTIGCEGISSGRDTYWSQIVYDLYHLDQVVDRKSVDFQALFVYIGCAPAARLKLLHCRGGCGA
jgi:hypothetical protein